MSDAVYKDNVLGEAFRSSQGGDYYFADPLLILNKNHCTRRNGRRSCCFKRDFFLSVYEKTKL